MENPDLPQEILVEIFSRIPAKSVGRCRSLSKSWKTHLSSPNFIEKHLFTRKQTIRQENLALITQSNSLCILTSPTNSDEVFKDESGTGRWICVFGSCNGLILLKGPQGLILMNPITLKQVTIPPLLAPERIGFGYYDYVRGLGYDSCTGDYKIVQFFSFKPKNGDGLRIVDVYSVKNGVWKTLDVSCYPYEPERYTFEGGVFVNGALHWLVRGNEGYSRCIAAFDLATEVFNEIRFPKGFVSQPGSIVGCNMPRSNGVFAVGDCLSIVDNIGNGVNEVWIMKEYGVKESWVKFPIQSEERDRHSTNLIVAMLCYVVDGEVLLLARWGEFFVCDLVSGTMRKVVLGERGYMFSHGMAFVDSLVSLE